MLILTSFLPLILSKIKWPKTSKSIIWLSLLLWSNLLFLKAFTRLNPYCEVFCKNPKINPWSWRKYSNRFYRRNPQRILNLIMITTILNWTLSILFLDHIQQKWLYVIFEWMKKKVEDEDKIIYILLVSN